MIVRSTVLRNQPHDHVLGRIPAVSAPEPAPSPGRLLVAVTRAHRAVFDAGLAPLGLRVGQEMVLLGVGAEDGLSQANLTRTLGVERATVSKALSRLERSGFVRRERTGPTTRVWLTEKGWRALPTARALWSRIDALVAESAGPDESAMVAALERVLTALKAVGAEEPS